jgi:hypothetical protein
MRCPTETISRPVGGKRRRARAAAASPGWKNRALDGVVDDAHLRGIDTVLDRQLAQRMAHAHATRRRAQRVCEHGADDRLAQVLGLEAADRDERRNAEPARHAQAPDAFRIAEVRVDQVERRS